MVGVGVEDAEGGGCGADGGGAGCEHCEHGDGPCYGEGSGDACEGFDGGEVNQGGADEMASQGSAAVAVRGRVASE
jgi:hypothetical protein